jgi:hypothetical protein
VVAPVTLRIEIGACQSDIAQQVIIECVKCAAGTCAILMTAECRYRAGKCILGADGQFDHGEFLVSSSSVEGRFYWGSVASRLRLSRACVSLLSDGSRM